MLEEFVMYANAPVQFDVVDWLVNTVQLISVILQPPTKPAIAPVAR